MKVINTFFALLSFVTVALAINNDKFPANIVATTRASRGRRSLVAPVRSESDCQFNVENDGAYYCSVTRSSDKIFFCPKDHGNPIFVKNCRATEVCVGTPNTVLGAPGAPECVAQTTTTHDAEITPLAARADSASTFALPSPDAEITPLVARADSEFCGMCENMNGNLSEMKVNGHCNNVHPTDTSKRYLSCNNQWCGLCIVFQGRDCQGDIWGTPSKGHGFLEVKGAQSHYCI